MNILQQKHRDFEKKKASTRRKKLALPITYLIGSLWTLGIILFVVFLGYLVSPWVRHWFSTVSETIK